MTVRRAYFENVRSLIEIHAVDFIAEESSDSIETYAQKIANIKNIPWRNVDLTRKEREGVPDVNPLGIGTQQDLDLQIFREWVWVIRTAKAMKQSALLVCGLAHLTGLGEKFLSLGFEVETHVYFDRTDLENLENRLESPGTQS